MNLAELQKKLLAVARVQAPSDRVPLAFEKRISARLALGPSFDQWSLWAHGLWRAAAPCFGIMTLLVAWSFFATPTNSPADDLSQELENTVLAAGLPEASPETAH